MKFRGQEVEVKQNLKEAVALTFALSIPVAFFWGRFLDPSIAASQPVVFAWIDMTMGLGAIAGFYVIFGKRVIENAVETFRKIRGGGTEAPED